MKLDIILFNKNYKLLFLSLIVCQSCSNHKINPKMKYRLDFYTFYNQFYISDKIPLKNTGNNMWTVNAYDNRLAVEDGFLGIRTQSYGHIKGELDLLNNANKLIDSERYDHIVEGGLDVKSGILQVISSPHLVIELTIKISPGIYRIRVYSSNLSNADIDEDEGNDYYKIEIWPDSIIEPKVLKSYVR